MQQKVEVKTSAYPRSEGGLGSEKMLHSIFWVLVLNKHRVFSQNLSELGAEQRLLPLELMLTPSCSVLERGQSAFSQSQAAEGIT